jgi:DNA-directed RNA polymerase beta' subunit
VYSKYIQFGALGAEEIAQLGETEIWQRELYDIEKKSPFEGGVLDTRLVTPLFA